MASIYRIKNSKNYYYSISLDGRHYQGTTKTDSKTAAKTIANAIEHDLINGMHNIPIKHNETFNQVWTKYYLNLTDSYKTKEYKDTASKHFLPFFSNLKISSIKETDIENYKSRRKIEIETIAKNLNKKNSEISYRSFNLELSALSHFFNYCIKQKIIQKNPCSGIKKLNELSRIKTLSDDDIQKLITGATNKLTRDLITFLIFSGCRKGEALNLKWDDVDLQNGIIAIKGTKTKYDRYIPISKPLKALLSGIEKNQDCLYVFNKNGAKLTDFKRSFHTACRNAGFKDLHIHDLRHVFASKMVMGGTSLFITGSLLGHRTTEMTKRYSHLVPETLKKAVDDVFDK